MPNTVRYFDSTQWGSPSLSGQVGTLIGVLDACLKDGFGSVTVNSLVVAANVATVSVSTGHHFAMIGAVGPVIRISGASPSGLNGDVRVTVVDTTTFTFATTGIANQTATGTITAKRAPAGFSKPFSATNKAVYRADDVTGTRMFLRVDDTSAQYPTLIAYETMSDVDTGTGASVGNQWFGKSNTADSTACPWRLIADGAAFYLLTNNAVGNTALCYGAMFWGDIVPILSTDAYHSVLIGHYTAAFSSTMLMGLGANNRNASIARGYTQGGSAIVCSREGHPRNIGVLGGQSSPATYPNAAGNDFLCVPVEVWTNAESILRGWMPGLYSTLHPGSSFTNGTIVDLVAGAGVSNRTMHIARISNDAATFDLTGPWR